MAIGNITAYGSGYATSDERLKTNIRPIENSLAKVKQLQGIMFDWTEEFLKDKPAYLRRPNTGLLAQQVEKVMPEVINVLDNGTLTLSYDKLIGLVINAINEISDQVDQIKNQLTK